jgi:hypothetical protein
MEVTYINDSDVDYKNAKEHSDAIIAQVTADIEHKYVAGQLEHGGKLWRKRLDNHERDELLDLIVYHYTRREQMSKLREILYAAYWCNISSDSVGNEALYKGKKGNLAVDLALTEALNLLEVGNEEGLRETEMTGNAPEERGKIGTREAV